MNHNVFNTFDKILTKLKLKVYYIGIHLNYSIKLLFLDIIIDIPVLLELKIYNFHFIPFISIRR
jgi:hypothetical protein